ncbi:MAG: YjbE family putative metal transport protein [Tabrizicola sp.]
MDLFTAEGFSALMEVVGINLVLSGDNAVVIGLAAAGLPEGMRARAIFFGILAATVLRVIFAALAVELLLIPGLVLIGGLLLLWICWRMWLELRAGQAEAERLDEALAGGDLDHDGDVADARPTKTFRQAAIQIVIADVSMSLDNVLAVAGAARAHTAILIFGLVLSIALMGLAAGIIARLLNHHRWIAYVGLAIILYVAVTMVWDGGGEVLGLLRGA